MESKLDFCQVLTNTTKVCVQFKIYAIERKKVKR